MQGCILKRKSLGLSALTLLSLAVLNAPAQAAEGFRITDLGTLPNMSVSPGAITNEGEVFGSLLSATSLPLGFHWSQRDGLQNLGSLGDSGASINGANNRGYAVGSVLHLIGPPTANPRPVFRRPIVGSSAGVRSLPTLGGNAEAFAINDNGRVVGYVADSEERKYAAIWESGALTRLGLLGGRAAEARSINNNGLVVGWSHNANSVPTACAWSGVAPTVLPSSSTEWTALGGMATDVNDAGFITGVFRTAQGDRGVIWQNGRFVVVLPPNTRLNALNEDAIAVGSMGSTPQTFHAIGWKRDRGMVDLNTMLPPNSGWVLQEARSINSRGQVVGVGLFQGQPRAFMLTPGDNPPSPPTGGGNGGGTGGNGGGQQQPRFGIMIEPRDIGSGGQAHVLIGLLQPAPAGGAVVTLTPSVANLLSLPATVNIPAGRNFVEFNVPAGRVTAITPLTVRITMGTQTASAEVRIMPAGTNPPPPPPPGGGTGGNGNGGGNGGGTNQSQFGIMVNPRDIPEGREAGGRIVLGSPAPAGGAIITLRSSEPRFVTVPERITVPAGQDGVNFSLRTGDVTVNTRVTLFAEFAAGQKRAQIEVNVVANNTTNPPPPPPGGGNGGGSTGGNGGGQQQPRFGIMIEPRDIGSGGQAHVLIGLLQPAPAGGAVVTLTPSVANLLSLPATVNIPAGRNFVEFNVPAGRVTAITPLTVRITMGTQTASAEVRIMPAGTNPPPPPPPGGGTGGNGNGGGNGGGTNQSQFGIMVNPRDIVTGGRAMGRMTIPEPAPTGGALVTLTPSIANLLAIPPTVTIPAGQRFVEFPVLAGRVDRATSLTLRATMGTRTAETGINIMLPPPPPGGGQAPQVRLSFQPATVKGGLTTLLVLESSEPTPAAGVTVRFTSSNQNLVPLTGEVRIPGGVRRFERLISTRVTTGTEHVTIRMEADGGFRLEAILTVTP